MKRFILLSICVFSFLSLSAQEVTYRMIENIPYRPAGDEYQKERCKIDLYYPENSEGFATVVWFHGGGLVGGEKFIPRELKNSGLAVVAVNYRFMNKVTIKECIEDAAAAVDWTFKEIGKYGGDTNKLFLSGHSAGGYLVTMIGLDKRWLAEYDIDADRVAALVPFSGQAITHYEHRKTQGIPSYEPRIDEYAPIRYVRPDAPRLVIVSGDREMELFGRYEENAYFWRMMKEAGHKETYIYELDGYDHGAMATPAFHILKNHIKEIIAPPSLP